jgi:hypothetical protein
MSAVGAFASVQGLIEVAALAGKPMIKLGLEPPQSDMSGRTSISVAGFAGIRLRSVALAARSAVCEADAVRCLALLVRYR